MLCYAMLCYAMLCYVMLCYALLCSALLGLSRAGGAGDELVLRTREGRARVVKVRRGRQAAFLAWQIAAIFRNTIAVRRGSAITALPGGIAGVQVLPIPRKVPI